LFFLAYSTCAFRYYRSTSVHRKTAVFAFDSFAGSKRPKTSTHDTEWERTGERNTHRSPVDHLIIERDQQPLPPRHKIHLRVFPSSYTGRVGDSTGRWPVRGFGLTRPPHHYDIIEGMYAFKAFRGWKCSFCAKMLSSNVAWTLQNIAHELQRV